MSNLRNANISGLEKAVNKMLDNLGFNPRQMKTLRELLLYGLIGSCTSLLDTFCYFLFTRKLGWNLFLSNVISIHIGIAGSFFLNTYLNFRKTDKLKKRALSFFIVGYCGMGLSMLLLYIGVKIFGFGDLAVKIVAIFIVALFQFILNKFITYTKI